MDIVCELDEHGVLLITWNRPERNNAWTYAFQDRYFEALFAAAADPKVRAIVVTGAGKTFCPGRDLEVLETLAEDPAHAFGAKWPMTLARRMPKPIVMAVNGACAGLGMVQIACADAVFASSKARFTTAFARRGLSAENMLSWLLPRQIGTLRALDLLLSARVVDAVEAFQMGLVTKVVEPDALLSAALEYARDLATNCSPQAMATIKRQVLDDLERSAEEAMEIAQRLYEDARAGADFAEGVVSFKEKRKPKFSSINIGIFSA